MYLVVSSRCDLSDEGLSPFLAVANDPGTDAGAAVENVHQPLREGWFVTVPQSLFEPLAMLLCHRGEDAREPLSVFRRDSGRSMCSPVVCFQHAHETLKLLLTTARTGVD